MKDLYNEKIKVLADRNGWSLIHARGYLDGDIARRRGTAPSMYARVGIDEYCLGFRAAYYERMDAGSDLPRNPAAPGIRNWNMVSKVLKEN